MFRTANPALNDNTFSQAQWAGVSGDVMTVQGTVNRTLILLALVLITAGWTWHLYYSQSPAMMAWMIGGFVGGLVFALATIFKPVWAGITAPGYALCEGLVLGGLSAMFEQQFNFIVIPAVGLTLGVALLMLVTYSLRLIQATEKFTMGVVMATGAIALVYLATMVLRFFNVEVPYIHSSGPFGIAFSLFVVVIASLNLILDFDFIERGAAQGAPRYMEWYGAFGLMVTLIWLYIEILRLLSKLRSRD